jgi:hypothetical protein
MNSAEYPSDAQKNKNNLLAQNAHSPRTGETGKLTTQLTTCTLPLGAALTPATAPPIGTSLTPPSPKTLLNSLQALK